MRRGLLVALGYLITAGATGLAQAQAVPKIKFEKYTLPNGLEVILHEDHSTPIVTVNGSLVFRYASIGGAVYSIR